MSFDEQQARVIADVSRCIDGPATYISSQAHLDGCIKLDTELPVPLEELGLYLHLERIHRGSATAQDFARIALIHPELVEGGALSLSEAGKHKLQVLRAKLAPSNDEPASHAAARDPRKPDDVRHR